MIWCIAYFDCNKGAMNEPVNPVAGGQTTSIPNFITIHSNSFILLTRADVHDMVEGVSALHDVHHQLGEAQVVLGEQRVDGDRLDHIVHEEESLGVLEAALCQVPPGASLFQCATLSSKRGGISVRC